MSDNYPSDYPRSRAKAIAALRTVRDEDIDFSEIPETTNFSNWTPVGEKFKKAAERNLAALNERMRIKKENSVMGKYIYVDNSNVWIEGKYHSAVEKGMIAEISEAHENKICDMGWAYDFQKLKEIVCDGNLSDVKRAVLYGSCPPENKSLWNAARKAGFEVFNPQRNAQNKEKRVDTGLIKEICKDLYKGTIRDIDEIILVVGDSDYAPVAEAIKDEKKKYTLAFWDNVAEIMKENSAKFINLNLHIKQFEKV